jgi:hypothetical protein
VLGDQVSVIKQCEVARCPLRQISQGLAVFGGGGDVAEGDDNIRFTFSCVPQLG